MINCNIMSELIKDFFKNLSVTDKPPVRIYSKTVLSNSSQKSLLKYQHSHVIKLMNILVKHYVALDSSDTGIGKTYIAVAICKELNRRPIIICPKTLIFNWINVLNYFGVKYYDVVNYETIKGCKTYKNENYKTRIESPFIKYVEDNGDDKPEYMYEWTLPDDTILIFDECHKCKDPSTCNGKLLVSTNQLKRKKIPVLLLSATICEKLTDAKVPFYLFGIIPNLRSYKNHIRTLDVKYPQHNINRKFYTDKEKYKSDKENSQAVQIYEEIKEYASRIRIKDLGDKFPSNQVCCQQFFAENIDEIINAYAEMAILMEELRTNNKSDHHLAKIVKLKQEIEFRKAPIFIEQARLYLDEGKSVVIFVNYLNTLNFIANELAINSQIHGKQTMYDREKSINDFQSNKEKIIICQIRAGSVGINLHDIHGGHPRVTLLNFPDAATDLIQALGRINRSGSKSPALQRIIFFANVDYEKKIMKNITRKLVNLSATNDGDLNGYKYNVKDIKRKKINKENGEIEYIEPTKIVNSDTELDDTDSSSVQLDDSDSSSVQLDDSDSSSVQLDDTESEQSNEFIDLLD